jgi:hypothetical protein
MLRRVTALALHGAPHFSRLAATSRRLLSEGVFGIPGLQQPQDFNRLAAAAIEKCEQIRRKVEWLVALLLRLVCRQWLTMNVMVRCNVAFGRHEEPQRARCSQDAGCHLQ